MRNAGPWAYFERTNCAESLFYLFFYPPSGLVIAVWGSQEWIRSVLHVSRQQNPLLKTLERSFWLQFSSVLFNYPPLTMGIIVTSSSFLSLVLVPFSWFRSSPFTVRIVLGLRSSSPGLYMAFLNVWPCVWASLRSRSLTEASFGISICSGDYASKSFFMCPR